MRRKDREMPRDFAIEVVDKCEWAVLSMIDEKGLPYSVPLSIVRYGEYIYFHSALAGYKIDCLKSNSNVCLSCVGDTNRLQNEFSTEYESAFVRGVAMEVLEENEKIDVLKILCQRHTPTNMNNFESEVKESLKRTGVWKVKIDDLTGKRKKYGRDGKELKFGKVED